MRRKMTWIIGTLLLATGAYAVWKTTSRDAYESPQYKVVVSDGAREIREYPDIVLATTAMDVESQGNDGSFMRLFRYISGNNDDDRKLAMTVPVFMEQPGDGDEGAEMGFVVPAQDVESGVPQPATSGVQIKTRLGGRFAVIRFSGRVSTKLTETKSTELRAWMELKGLVGESTQAVAGYDPPWLPGALRRNEILIRLEPTERHDDDE